MIMSSMRTPPLPSFTPIFYYLLLSLFGGGGVPPLFFLPTTIFASAGIMKTNPCPEVPTLICQHGSFCTPGNANYGPEHAHLQLQTSESGYYCDCNNDGYIGHECQISVDKCTGGGGEGGGVPYCYHGAQCQVRKGKYYCDCHTLNQHSLSTAVKYAGSACQHPSTSFCATSLVDNHAPNFQFCTNDGICNRWVQDGESHPGCSCLDGYAGERCEIEMNDPYADMAQFNSSGSGGGGNSTARTAGIVLLVLALVILIPVITCLVMRARRRKRRNALATAFAGTSTATVDGKTVVGEGNLDADGSGTLGSSMIHDEKNDDMTENGNGAHHDEDDDDDELTIEEVDDKADDAANGETTNGNAAPLSEIV